MKPCAWSQEWRKRLAHMDSLEELSAAVLAVEGGLSRQLDGLPTKADDPGLADWPEVRPWVHEGRHSRVLLL